MKKFKSALVAVFGLFLLSSCSWPFPLETSSSSYTPPIGVTGGYYQSAALSENYYKYGQAQQVQYLPASGSQKMLVVPVDFTNYPSSVLPSDTRTRIARSFFGSASETSWESVASFYDESSYGNLSISGEVTDWVHMGISTTDLINIYQQRQSQYYDATYYVLEKIYSSLDQSLLSEYDQDGDGYIDGLWIIYSAPTYANNSALDSTYWAYTYWYYETTYINKQANKPIPGVFAWASYTFMNDGYGSSGIDAHTFIHESGHMMGLDDYYNYDYDPRTNSDAAAPMGYIDMMDYNIIDHNAFSKMALGWIAPTVVTDTATITIEPSYETPAAILIKDGWNGSPFDEYILMEFYEPKGLNEKDSVDGPYPGNNVQGFTTSGLRVYHIDARLALTKYNTSYDLQSYSYVDYIENGYVLGDALYFTEVAHSNTPSFCIANDEKPLISIVDGTSRFTHDTIADNSVIFTPGEGLSSLGQFDDGTDVGYSFEVLGISDAGLTVQITKI